MIINHDHPAYRRNWKKSGDNRFNGAFYYSKEITKNIIPLIETDRNWITINVRGYAYTTTSTRSTTTGWHTMKTSCWCAGYQKRAGK